MKNFNWQSEHLGKKVIDENGKIGKFIANCDYPTFTVEFKEGDRLSAAIGSPIGTGWKLVEEEKFFYGEDIDVTTGIKTTVKAKRKDNILEIIDIKEEKIFKESYFVGNDYARKEMSGEIKDFIKEVINIVGKLPETTDTIRAYYEIKGRAIKFLGVNNGI